MLLIHHPSSVCSTLLVTRCDSFYAFHALRAFTLRLRSGLLLIPLVGLLILVTFTVDWIGCSSFGLVCYYTVLRSHVLRTLPARGCCCATFGFRALRLHCHVGYAVDYSHGSRCRFVDYGCTARARTPAFAVWLLRLPLCSCAVLHAPIRRMRYVRLRSLLRSVTDLDYGCFTFCPLRCYSYVIRTVPGYGLRYGCCCRTFAVALLITRLVCCYYLPSCVTGYRFGLPLRSHGLRSSHAPFTDFVLRLLVCRFTYAHV